MSYHDRPTRTKHIGSTSSPLWVLADGPLATNSACACSRRPGTSRSVNGKVRPASFAHVRMLRLVEPTALRADAMRPAGRVTAILIPGDWKRGNACPLLVHRTPSCAPSSSARSRPARAGSLLDHRRFNGPFFLLRSAMSCKRSAGHKIHCGPRWHRSSARRSTGLGCSAYQAQLSFCAEVEPFPQTGSPPCPS